ncbi:MAG: ABC transporter permease [Candidatus Hodarchaeales archaeon]
MSELKNWKISNIKKLDFLAPFAIVALLWEFFVFFGFLNPLLFPPPTKIFVTFLELLFVKSPSLGDHILRSLFHIIIGYSLGVALGILVGALMGTSKFFYNAINPILALLIPVPTLAWVPLLLIIIGIGDEMLIIPIFPGIIFKIVYSKTIIIAIFLGCFFPIVYNTINGVRSADIHLIWAAQTMGASKFDIYLKVLLPSSLLSIITGLRLAVGYSWRALVGAEMITGVAVGIGHMIYAARYGFHLDVVFTGLIIIAFGGLLMDRVLMRRLERITVEKWGVIEKRGEA